MLAVTNKVSVQLSYSFVTKKLSDLCISFLFEIIPDRVIMVDHISLFNFKQSRYMIFV